MAIIDCPSCGRRISDLAVECPHCGWEVDREPPPEMRRPPEEPSGTVDDLAPRQPGGEEGAGAERPRDRLEDPGGPRAGGWTSQPAPGERRETAGFGAGSGAPPRPPNYLVPSIIATICCCLPFGIVAIVYAAQVNGKAAAGDLDGAREASDKARIWTIAAVAFGLLAAAFWLVWSLAMGDFGQEF